MTYFRFDEKENTLDMYSLDGQTDETVLLGVIEQGYQHLKKRNRALSTLVVKMILDDVYQDQLNTIPQKEDEKS